MHDSPLIATIVIAIVLAFVFGAVAQRLRVSPLVGYLLAGVAVGPFTPGYVADQGLAAELAEIGVILLMFGVGLHFSLKDLLSVRMIAIPGAIVQIAAATVLGVVLSATLGWDLAGGFVFGLALSVASTVVLLRALEERRLTDSSRGRIAVGWLVVEDIVMVLVLVLLPSLAGEAAGQSTFGSIALALVITLGKVGAFVLIMLVAGRRLIPWVLHFVAHTGSRELFRLAVLALALGTAFGAATIFGVSFALGAFFAGMILGESTLSQQAARETLPLRDAFAVLFFVSVGMLIDPLTLLRDPWPLLATVGIILLGKSIAAYLIMRLFRQTNAAALLISASLAQIGEFSFILAGLGMTLGVLPAQGRDLILAGAIISIMLNPLWFFLLDRWEKKSAQKQAPVVPPAGAQVDHRAILVGHGRVGSIVLAELKLRGVPVTVIDDIDERVGKLREQGVEVITGNAASPEILDAADLPRANWLFVAVPNSFEAGQIVAHAKQVNPQMSVIARAHSTDEAKHLSNLGADRTILGERELAIAMVKAAFPAGVKA